MNLVIKNVVIIPYYFKLNLQDPLLWICGSFSKAAEKSCGLFCIVIYIYINIILTSVLVLHKPWKTYFKDRQIETEILSFKSWNIWCFAQFGVIFTI